MTTTCEACRGDGYCKNEFHGDAPNQFFPDWYNPAMEPPENCPGCGNKPAWRGQCAVCKGKGALESVA
jgi:hypothetical protein